MIEEINNHWSVEKMEKPFGRGINFQIEVTDFSQTYIGTIYDNFGRIIEQAPVVPGKMNSYDASILENGIYYFKVITNKGVYTQKFIVKK